MLRQQNKLLVTKCAAAASSTPRTPPRSAQRSAAGRPRRNTRSASANTTRNCRRRSKSRTLERLQAQNARLRSQPRARRQLVRAADASQSSSNWSYRCEQSFAGVRGIALAGLEPDPPLLQGPLHPACLPDLHYLRHPQPPQQPAAVVASRPPLRHHHRRRRRRPPASAR